MSRLAVVAVLLGVVTISGRRAAASGETAPAERLATDDETPAAPNRSSTPAADTESAPSLPPPPELHHDPILGLSFVMRVPSGPGVELTLYPARRLELGIEVSTWILISEFGAFARVAVLQQGDQSLTVGARVHGLLYALADTDGDPMARMVSAELGYTLHAGSFLFGLTVSKAVRTNADWTAFDRRGFTGELRLGHTW